jgi:hypothetical protein
VTCNKKGENKHSDHSVSPEEYGEAASPVNLKEANETLSAGEQNVSQHYNSKLQMISLPQRQPLYRYFEKQMGILPHARIMMNLHNEGASSSQGDELRC